MKTVDGWYFQIPVKASSDAHYSMVEWLAERNLSHLFPVGEDKSVGYFEASIDGQKMILARSSVEIDDPAVVYKKHDYDNGVMIAIRINATQKVRAPNLKHEVASRSRVTKNGYRTCTDTELREKVVKAVGECGIEFNHNDLWYAFRDPIEVVHKKQKIVQQKACVDAVVSGRVVDADLFSKAWKKGVGSNKAYGFGLVRFMSAKSVAN